MEPTTTAARTARILLAAWNSADLTRIRGAIDQAHSAPPASVRSLDMERIELVQETASVIEQWMEGRKSGPDLNACLSLLRHLAGSGASGKRVEAPLLEMRAYVRH